jgi:quinol monooxygenase YgiN
MEQEFEIVRIPVREAKALQLIEALQAARAGYLAAPACQGLTLMLNEAADEVAAVVTWSSADAHNEAAKTPEAGAFFQVVTSFANGRPDVRRYRPAGAGSA